MRQLKLTRQRSPAQQAAYEADRAQALPLLRQLAEASPLPCSEKEAEQAHFPHIVSIAMQYRDRGASWAELLTAGYTALAKHLTHYAERPEKAGRFLAWEVRQGILRALPEK